MKGKALVSSKRSPSPKDSLAGIVCKPEPLRAILPKFRRIENQNYLRNITVNHPAIYANGDYENETKQSPLKQRRIRGEEKKPLVGRYCEILEDKELAELTIELFPKDLSESLVKLPEIQNTPVNEGTIATRYPTRHQTRPHSKSPPTLGNILRTAKKAHRRLNYTNIVESRFEGHLSIPRPGDLRDAEEFQYKN